MIDLFPSREVALSIAGFSIHWYGLMYLTGFLLGYLLAKRLQHYRGLHLSNDEWSSVVSGIVLGVLIGGRLGFVVLYEPQYFLQNPLEILAVWQGGMASHGGFIGVMVAILYLHRKYRFPLWAFADVIVVPVAIGLALGRLGNFINYELYGTVTQVPWGMSIPGVEGLRHPTALYAIGKNLCIAGICYAHLRRPSAVPGRTVALFLILYGLLRAFVEMFREQPHGFFDLGIVELSRGQLYTIPLIALGVGLWWWRGQARSTGSA